MKIIIDIPRAKYNTLRNDSTDYRGNIGVIYRAVQNGTIVSESAPIDVMTDIVSEIESQDPADYGRTYQERSSAECMKQNILEIIKERVKYE